MFVDLYSLFLCYVVCLRLGLSVGVCLVLFMFWILLDWLVFVWLPDVLICLIRLVGVSLGLVCWVRWFTLKLFVLL